MNQGNGNASGGNGTPAGWYRDAQGTMRWWDGAGWTERVQGGEPPAVSPYGEPTPAASAPEPWYKKRRWQVVAAVVAVFVIAGAMGGEGEGEAPAAASAEVQPGDAPAASSEATPKSESKTQEATTKPSEKPKPKPQPKPAPAAMNASAVDMLAEFEGNEAAADAKYKGKTVKVTGTAVKVDTEFWDDEQYVIQINGGGDWDILTVNCNDVSASVAAGVQVNSTVTVVGTFDDGGDLGVELKECTVA